jgi:anti-sigma factor RsiW
MTCKEVADFLLEYTSGGLAPGVREQFEAHLRRCANCREYLALYRSAVELGRHAFDDIAAVDAGVPEDLVAAILTSRQREHDTAGNIARVRAKRPGESTR